MITGSNGFVGRALVPLLEQRGHAVASWSRSSGWFDLASPAPDSEQIWVEQLRNTDVVIHLAAHVHVLGDVGNDERERHWQVNCQGTLRLAAAALAAGVRRFIFLSTAKVFGEGEDGPYTPLSPARPQDAYASSKWGAEQGLRQLTAHTPMEAVIIRPPLVYGAGVSANFRRLQRLASLPIPLPIAAIENRRAMIGIDNLIDLIATCIDAPAAAGQLLLCADDHPYSLAEVVATMRSVQGRRGNLFALPPSWVRGVAGVTLGQAAAQRLFGNFELDISATRSGLGWRPPLSMAAILRAASSRPTS